MSLWRQPEFLKLWAGQTISVVGTLVTQLALGLTAATLLGASPIEMGVLGLVESVPFLLFGLPAGVWVDRVRRRPLLICSDLGRALLLLSVPLAAALGWLTMAQLYVVGFGLGSLNVLFSVAYGSFLPSVVARADLHEGNNKLALGEALARVTGSGLAGVLVQALTAPVALVADALSFVASAVSIVLIRAREPAVSSGVRRDVWLDVRAGIGSLMRNPLLRPLLIGSNLGNLGDGMLFGSNVALLFLSRDLAFEPATIGLVLSGLGVGGLIGAATAGPVTRSIGVGRVIVGSMALWGVGFAGLAVVPDAPFAPVAVAALIGCVGAVNPIAGASVSTMRQALTPEHVLGRVTSVVRVATWGSIALGSLLGGLLAERIGVRPTVLVSGVLPLIGFVWLALSPVMQVRRLDSSVGCSDDY